MMRRRIWVLLAVALLLPFKGALAAAGMFCHSGSSPVAHGMASPHEHHQAPDAHDHALHGAAHGMPSTGAADEGPDPVNLAASCAICSAVCASPPLPRAGAGIEAAVPATAERFPPLAVPRPSAFPDGLERPPRTI